MVASVCGGESCIRRGGQIEDNGCCDKTAYDWVYDNPGKPACASAPRNIPCHQQTTTPTPTTCTGNPLCELILHSAFANCSQYVDLNIIKQNCDFDSCGNRMNTCSALEYAAQKCKIAGFCIDWRRLTNGTCASIILEPPSSIIVQDVSVPVACSGQEITQTPVWMTVVVPGDVWQSNCHLCTCNNQTLTVECSPLSVSSCGPNAVLFNTSCCGNQTCGWRQMERCRSSRNIIHLWKRGYSDRD
ncbi:hypothetical protein PAMP_014908 [Pampus punctatissimus]